MVALVKELTYGSVRKHLKSPKFITFSGSRSGAVAPSSLGCFLIRLVFNPILLKVGIVEIFFEGAGK